MQEIYLQADSPPVTHIAGGCPTVLIYDHGIAQVFKKYGGANPWKKLSDSGIAHQQLILLWADPTIVLSIWGYPTVLIYYHGIAQVFKKCGGANPWKILSDSGIAHK
jgi:hypothetical protein